MKAHSHWYLEEGPAKGVRLVVKLWPTNGMHYRRMKSNWYDSGNRCLDAYRGRMELERRIAALGI